MYIDKMLEQRRREEAIIQKRVRKKTRCTYYARGRMLFPPGGGCKIRYYIKSPFRYKSSITGNMIRPYLWTWNDSFIYNMWAKWAWKHVERIEEEVRNVT